MSNLTKLEKLIYDSVCVNEETTFCYLQEASIPWIIEGNGSKIVIDRLEIKKILLSLSQKGLIVAKLSNVKGYIDFYLASPVEIVVAKQGNVSIPKELTD